MERHLISCSWHLHFDISALNLPSWSPADIWCPLNTHFSPTDFIPIDCMQYLEIWRSGDLKGERYWWFQSWFFKQLFKFQFIYPWLNNKHDLNWGPLQSTPTCTEVPEPFALILDSDVLLLLFLNWPSGWRAEVCISNRILVQGLTQRGWVLLGTWGGFGLLLHTPSPTASW